MSKLKLLFAAAVATVAFAAVASSASAYTASLEGGEISSPSVGKVTFGSSPTIACNLTLAGSLASSVELTRGAHLGEVSSVRIANCSGGSVENVLGLPWEITINSILGTLPSEATGILFNIVGASFNLSVFGGLVNCLYSGDAGALLEVFEEGANTYGTEGIIALAEVRLPFVRGSGLCPSSGGFRGAFSLSPAQTIVVS